MIGFAGERVKEFVDYVTNPRFWVTTVLFTSFCQLLASLSFLFYKNVFDVSPTYTWLSGITTQHTWGVYGLAVALLNFTFIKHKIMALLFPLTIMYWSLLSYGSMQSVSGITPGGTFTFSIAIFCALAYVSAGGFKMLYYKGKSRYGYTKRQEN